MAITDTLSRIQIPHEGICFHPSVFIMRVNVSLVCSYWSCIKSHCYIPIQQWARWGNKEGWPNVMVTTCSIVKGSFIDQDRQRERERGDISAGPLLSDILEKLSFLFCHHLFLSTKSIDALTVAILAMAFTPSRDHERVQMYRYKAGSLVHYIYQM